LHLRRRPCYSQTGHDATLQGNGFDMSKLTCHLTPKGFMSPLIPKLVDRSFSAQGAVDAIERISRGKEEGMSKRGQEFPPIGALVGGAQFPSANPRRNDPLRYNLVNAEQIISGILRTASVETESLTVRPPESYGDSPTQWFNGDQLVAAIGGTGIAHSRELWIHSANDFDPNSQATVAVVLNDSGIQLGAGAGSAPDWLVSRTGNNEATIANGDSLQFGGSTAMGRLDDGGFVQLSDRSDPATPPAGKLRFYCKTSGGRTRLFSRSDDGTVDGPF
jgi:hypothetical protein